ncbi:MAG: hypothetical protein HQ592_09350 [Planctomycetes bacterium]|nr:hypothetical protein [Planctomycetota bacterium]
MRRILIAAAVGMVVVAAAACPADARDTRAQDKADRKRSENMERKFKHFLDEENISFGKKLEELAKWCGERGLNVQAAELWVIARKMDPKLEGDPPATPDATPADDDKAEFDKEKGKLFRDHASELFKLGAKCYKTGLIGRAYDMVWQVIHYDPDHAQARKLLGQVKFRGEWRRKYDTGQVKRGKIFTDEYGWIPKEYLSKYDEGMMPVGGKWYPKETVEDLRNEWAHAWKYNTEHFEIKTNVGLADAVAFGKIVEENYNVFFSVFVSYFSPKSQSQMLFGSKRSKARMKVNYFATQEQYATAVGVGGATLGVYLGRARTSNFFKMDWHTNIRVLKHETTHQMLAEMREKTRPYGFGAWVVEAAATYMETCYRQEDGRISTEGKDAPWVKNFIPILESGNAMPLKKFDKLFYEGFQASGIGYPQSAALALFLMEAEDGKCRERFVDYLTAYYTGKLFEKGAMSSYIGVRFAELEKEFHLFYIGKEGVEKLEKLMAEREEAAE